MTALAGKSKQKAIAFFALLMTASAFCAGGRAQGQNQRTRGNYDPVATEKLAPAFIKVESSSDHPRTKILFIGQSILFAYNMPHIFHMLAKAKRPGDDYLIEMVAGGGYSLKDHYADGTALKELRKQHWDYVVIQESTFGQIALHKIYEQYAPFFDQEARRAGAVPLQFEGYDDYRGPESTCPMHLEAVKVSQSLRETMIPVGVAWRYVTKYYPSIRILGADMHHPSALGSYLMACVLYSVIYQEAPTGAEIIIDYQNQNTGKTETLDSAHDPQAQTLAQTAWTVVKSVLNYR